MAKKKYVSNLEKIFDDAMKKAGFEPIPVGPLPWGQSKKAKKQKNNPSEQAKPFGAFCFGCIEVLQNLF